MKLNYHLDPESGAWRQLEIHLLESIGEAQKNMFRHTKDRRQGDSEKNRRKMLLVLSIESLPSF